MISDLLRKKVRRECFLVSLAYTHVFTMYAFNDNGSGISQSSEGKNRSTAFLFFRSKRRESSTFPVTVRFSSAHNHHGISFRKKIHFGIGDFRMGNLVSQKERELASNDCSCSPFMDEREVIEASLI